MTSADTKKAQFNDCKSAGDIASQQKLSEEDTSKDYYDSAELKFTLDNPDSGCPDKMYQALVAAQELGIIGSDTRWDEGLTKSEAIQLYLDALQAYTKQNGYPIDQTAGTGDTSGTVVEQQKPVEQGDPSNGTDMGGMDNIGGMSDDEVQAEAIDSVTSIEAADFEIVPMDDTTMYCTSNSANIRKGPNTEYDKVGTLSYAQEIVVNGKVETADSTWYVIKTESTDDIQMVSGSLLSTTKPQPPQTSKPSGNTGNTSNTQPSNGDSGQPSGGGGQSSGGIVTDDGEPPMVDSGWTPPGSSRTDWGGLQ